MRAVTAMLCTVLLLLRSDGSLSPLSGLVVLLLVYDLWAGWLLWQLARGRRAGPVLLHYVIDVTWTGLLIQLSGPGSQMLIFTAVLPVLVASIDFGIYRGCSLALFAAAWTALQDSPATPAWDLGLSIPHTTAALAVLVLVPIAAVLARPVSQLRLRLELVRDLEIRLDPRRGLAANASALADALRTTHKVGVAAVVLPAAADGPALLTSDDDPPFEAPPAVQRRLEELLRMMPLRALVHRRGGGLGGFGAGTEWMGEEPAPAGPAPREALDKLCTLLDQREVLVVPLVRYGKPNGHLLLGGRPGLASRPEIQALADAAPDISRLLDQSALVDRLLRETSEHERVRIGRDLHDSAIQPYLGLKFALEALTLRVLPDNPVRPELLSLSHLVEGEIDCLRDIITGLRNGQPSGDNALIPALRRQVRHFSQIFGIDVELHTPAEIRATRALAGAVFHMVNEALNNVRRHTLARHVKVTMELMDGWMCLRVLDDGATQSGQPAAPFIPRSLSERVAELRGTLSVEHPDGLNTEIHISMPWHTPAAT